MDERWAQHLRGNAEFIELGEDGEPMGEPAPDLDESDLSGVRKADLQRMAEEMGLSTDGTKAELAERIRVAQGDFV